MQRSINDFFIDRNKEAQWNRVNHWIKDGDNTDNLSDQNNDKTCNWYKQTIYNYCLHMRWSSKVVNPRVVVFHEGFSRGWGKTCYLSKQPLKGCNLMFTSYDEGNNCFIIPNGGTHQNFQKCLLAMHGLFKLNYYKYPCIHHKDMK